MRYRAIRPDVELDGFIYQPGEIIGDASKEQFQKLLKAGKIAEYIEDKKPKRNAAAVKKDGGKDANR